MAFQYPTTDDPLYRNNNAVLASEWTAGGTAGVKVSPTWGGVGVYGTTANRLCWVSRAIDVDGQVDWLWHIESVPALGTGGIGDRSGPGLIDAAGTNCKFWVWATNGTQFYIGTEIATIPNFALIGTNSTGGAYHSYKRGRLTVVAGVIGAGARACEIYLSLDGITYVLYDSDTIDASAVAIVTQGAVAPRNNVLLIDEKKVT